MKNIFLILIAMFFIACNQQPKDKIEKALIEYYNEDRIQVYKTLDGTYELSEFTTKDYEFIDYNIVSTINYADVKTIYKIEHTYLVTEYNRVTKKSHKQYYTDVIKVEFEGDNSTVKDNTIWSVNGDLRYNQ